MAENPSAEVATAPGSGARPPVRRTLSILAWTIVALTLAMTTIDIGLLFLNRNAEHPPGLGNDAVEMVAAVAYAGFGVLGAAIASRRPSNAVGWIFCGGALVTAAGAASSEYAGYALITRPGALPAATVVAWLGAVAWWAGAGTVLTFGLLLYPNGRLLSPRWRSVAWVGLTNLVVLVLLHVLAPGSPYGEFSVGANPVGIDAAADALRAARNLAWILFAANGILSTAAVVARLRQSYGMQREQLQWLACAGALSVVAVVLWALSHSERRASPAVLQATLALGVLAIPVAAWSAIAKVSTLQRSVARLVLAREEERRRLRRDLHDGLGPSLGAAVLQLGQARRLAKTDATSADQILGRLTLQLQEVIADVRSVVDDLRPASLDQLGLVGALRQRAADLQLPPSGDPQRGLRVVVDAEGDFGGLAAAVEVAAFRIVTEALNNAVRHSGAARCTVRLAVDGDLILSIEDDGRGLSGGSRPGVGLGSMRERASELGGTCDIEPGPAGGTVVRARLPLHDAHA